MNKILFITGSRSEYGLIKNLITILSKNKKIKCHVIVTGNHMSREYGNSKSFIIKENSVRFHYVDLKIKNSKTNDILNAMSTAFKLYNLKYNKIKPDKIILVGDRFESYAAAIVAKINNIKLIHFHGGETTTGAYDNYWRHSISIMSDLHFVANNHYKDRVAQIIGSKKNVFNVGGLGIDNIKKINFKNKIKISKEFEFVFNKFNMVIVYHSVTNSPSRNKSNFKKIIAACNNVKDTNFFISYPGYDLGSDAIISEIKKILNKSINTNKFTVFKNLGEENFLSLCKVCDCIIGNSSSGIIEAPYLKIPTINLGSRQNGRIKDKSIYDCEIDTNLIKNMINRIIILKLKNKTYKSNNIYGKGNAATKASEIINRDG